MTFTHASNGDWRPVALSSLIEPGTSAGTHLDGAEFVVWRDAGGAVHVWEDRCPHRGMKLSFGFVRGDHIACLYHGWQYDTAGRCRYIPAHPDIDVPKTIAVPVFPAVEAGGIVWTSPVPGTIAPAPVMPDETTPVRSLYLDRPAAEATATLGGDAIGPGLVRVAKGGDTLLVAVQAVDRERSALHIVAEGANRDITAHLAWAAAFRREVEAALADVEAARCRR